MFGEEILPRGLVSHDQYLLTKYSHSNFGVTMWSPYCSFKLGSPSRDFNVPPYRSSRR